MFDIRLRLLLQTVFLFLYLFLFSFLLIFDHLLQLVVGSCILCLKFLALDSQVTTKLLHLDEEV